MELATALIWIIGEGGAAILAYWCMEHIAYLATLQSEIKRYAAFVLTGAIAALAYLTQIGMTFQEPPADWRGWINALFNAVATAIIAGQALHARKKLKEQ